MNNNKLRLICAISAAMALAYTGPAQSADSAAKSKG